MLTDVLNAIGSLLLGFGTVGAAVLAFQSKRAARGAHEAAAENSTKADVTVETLQRVDQSVGVANGESLIDLMHKVTELETYSHERNHDIIGKLTLVTGGIPLLIQLTEAQTSTLTEIRDLLSNSLDNQPEDQS